MDLKKIDLTNVGRNDDESFIRFYSLKENNDITSLLIVIIFLESKIEKGGVEKNELLKFFKKSMDNSMVEFGELFLAIEEFCQKNASFGEEKEKRILNIITEALFAS